MNIEDIVQRLSDKSGIRRKAVGKIVAEIISTIQTDLLQGVSFTFEGVGTIKRMRTGTSVQNLSDGSYRVCPPKLYMEFMSCKSDNSLEALRSTQRAVSHLASGTVDSYAEAETAFKEFSKIIRKSLDKGKKVKLSGIGTFRMSTENNSEIEFEVSAKLNDKLNDCFGFLEEKITFPIPPLSLTKDLEPTARHIPIQDATDDTTSDENNFMKRKLAIISQDLIRLNEEINGKVKKDGGSGLWG